MWRDDYPKQKKRKKKIIKKKINLSRGPKPPWFSKKRKEGSMTGGGSFEPLLRSTIGKRGPAVGRRSAVVAPARPPRTPTATTSSKERERGVGQRGREARREGGSPATTYAGKGPGRRRCGRRRPVDARPAIPLIGRRLIWAERETGAKGGSRGSIFGHPDPVRPPPPAWPLLPDAGDTAASSMGSERERQRQSKGRDRTHTEPTRTKP